jgi:hypothetical protein
MIRQKAQRVSFVNPTPQESRRTSRRQQKIPRDVNLETLPQ